MEHNFRSKTFIETILLRKHHVTLRYGETFSRDTTTPLTRTLLREEDTRIHSEVQPEIRHMEDLTESQKLFVVKE